MLRAMFATLYIAILCLSTVLSAYAANRVAHRVQLLFGLESTVPAGLFAIVSALVFLTVVGAPPPLLVGTVMLVGAGFALFLPITAQYGIPLVATLLGLGALHITPIGPLPVLAVSVFAVALWYAITLSAHYLSDEVRPASIALTAILLPLAIAPLFTATPAYIALDAGLLIAALTGLVLTTRQPQRLGPHARPALGLLTGWLMLDTALHGGWLFALISLLAWGAAIAYATLQPRVEPYAFTR